MYGKEATADNDFRYDWLPKLDVSSDVLRTFELMHQGTIHGYFCQGFNPPMAFPNKKKLIRALSQLKFPVVMDPPATGTASFWENHGQYNDVDPTKNRTEVFRLLMTCFTEEDRSLTNSGRCLQWHWKGADVPGESRSDIVIMTDLFLRLRDMDRKHGGAFSEPVLGLHWPYKLVEAPSPDEIAREVNGYVVDDITDPKDASVVQLRAGQQLDGFPQLRDGGKPACGCRIYSGCFTEKGNQMARRVGA